MTTATNKDREGKPFAPLQALLPAARCKIWIDQAYDVCSTLPSCKGNKDLQYKTLVELEKNLSQRPKLFVKGEKPRATTNTLTAQITTSVSTANKEQYQRNREDLSLPTKFAAMLNQADVERQWGILQSNEANRAKENEIRAAFNYYTQQLEFGDSYLLTASKEDRKRMIRNDQLPSLTAVITSDLDLRDLYRNQLLTAVDDVQAEVAYQLRLASASPEGEIDVTDVIDLMNQAHTACSNWFDLIAREDVKDAIEEVQKKG